MGLVFANVPQAQAIRWTVEVSSKIFDCADVMAYGIFRKVTTLEFFQHHFAKSGHGDGLLMTRQLISTFRQPPLHYLTRSVRRTSGFVLARHPPSMAASAIGLIDEPGAPEYAPPRTSHRFPSMRSRISGSSGRTSDKGESAMKRKVTYSAAVLLLLVVGVAWAQRTDVSRLFPIYNNGGKPDLTVDPKRFISQMEIVDRFFDSSSCELIEGSIGGTGYRRLL